MKLIRCFISAVGMPLTPAPPALRPWPEVVRSQKLLVTLPPLMKPIKPPTGTAPETLPAE